MPEHEGIGNIDAEVKGLPERGTEVAKPEIMARGGHHEENKQRADTERLEWKVRDPQRSIGIPHGLP